MRILFLSTAAFFPDHVSDQNQTVLELAGALGVQGHEAIILSGRTNAGSHSNAVVSERGYGFRVFRAHKPLRALPVLCATLRPDVAVVIDGDFEGIVEACRQLDLPLAVWFFNAEPHYFRRGSPDEGLLYLATSPFLVGRLRSLLGIDAELLPPYIERDRYRVPADGRRVLFVNPVRQKGVETAFALARARPDVAFAFVESWGLSEGWRQHCFDLALACGNIEWVPKTIERGSVFKRGRLLLLPQLTEEGCCRLVPEAQLAGIPVLATDRAAMRENVGPGGTVLPPDARPEAWLEALDRYLGDDAEHATVARHGLAHAQRAELDGAAIVERLIERLSSGIAQQRARRRIGR